MTPQPPADTNRADRLVGRTALVSAVATAIVVAISLLFLFSPPGRSLIREWRATHARVPLPPEWYAGASRTLIIFGRTSCPACASSQQFHETLARTATEHGFRVLAANTSRDEDPVVFAVSIGVPPVRAVRAVPPPAEIARVPTVLIVDGSGRVLQKRDGVLSDGERADLLAAVQASK